MRNVPGVLARRQVAPIDEPTRKEVKHMEGIRDAFDAFVLFFSIIGFAIIICII